MKAFKLTWTIHESQDSKVLREFLKEQHISKAALVDIKFKGGRIEVNGQEENVRYLLKSGDNVEVFFPLETTSEGLLPENLPLDILYEDDFVLVLNKPPFVNTIPSREHPTGSIANRLAGYYQVNEIPSTVHVVTRLDRDTSGIMLIAKHRYIHHLLSEQQKAAGVSRTYEALVHGKLEGENDIEEPIGRKSTSIIEREVRMDGQYARTSYQVLENYQDFTHVQLKLYTGRTHQIRVHMAYIHHPLLGDDLYGGSRLLINRQALHCKQLSFIHPHTNELMTFDCEMPVDMKKLIE
ncbi:MULTISPECIES: RluA family pseudouridine synthase [Bacillus]|uniref:RluA family pseudouridine synthase n=1 Tax=Bacillus TaxID=1386 RepID=UPI0003037373|nr:MULTISPECIES: RluA family pseudouridine synthase [Bacillus]